VAWTTTPLADGSTVDFYMQQFENECGPSCVATVVRLMTSRNMDIQQARRAVGEIDWNQPPSGTGRSWTVDWAYMTSLTQVLSANKVTMASTIKNLKDGTKPAYGQEAPKYKEFVSTRTKAAPAILRVQWKNGGHFVVTVGQNGAKGQDFIEILDPHYGYQTVDLATFPKYKPVKGTDKGDGELDRFWSIRTTVK
jgi:hypothetical protein